MQESVARQAPDRLLEELGEGIALAKCRICGCMRDALEAIGDAFPISAVKEGESGRELIEQWKQSMQPIKYACLGCAHCYPAEAMNLFDRAFPHALHGAPTSCSFMDRGAEWPPVAGDYTILDPKAPVAISTLGSVGLADEIASASPGGVCIVGKTETENIGIDKLVRNVAANDTIRFLVIAGVDPAGHLPGQTLISLSKNGVDESMRVIGPAGKRPVLRNTTSTDVDMFRRRVQVIDMRGCIEATAILDRVATLSSAAPACGCSGSCDESGASGVHAVPVIPVQAVDSRPIRLDKAGYFVILPQAKKGTIVVEHYSYDDLLLHSIEGKDAKSLCSAVIDPGWVTLLSHAAYLGKELEKAELSIRYGFPYVQDGA